MVVELTVKNFEEEVLNYKGKVLIDVWAPWCGPCRMLSPIVDEISEENPGFKVCKVNADDEEKIAMDLNVSAIPALFVYENGEIFAQRVGLCSKEDIYKLVKGE